MAACEEVVGGAARGTKKVGLDFAADTAVCGDDAGARNEDDVATVCSTARPPMLAATAEGPRRPKY